jgi:hypothetical protein
MTISKITTIFLINSSGGLHFPYPSIMLAKFGYNFWPHSPWLSVTKERSQVKPSQPFQGGGQGDHFVQGYERCCKQFILGNGILNLSLVDLLL